MNPQSLRALVVLNLVLLTAVTLVSLLPEPAQAQIGRSDYLMISGEVTGRTNQAAVYIIELRTARIASIIFSSSDNKLEVIGSPYNLAGDLNAAGGNR